MISGLSVSVIGFGMGIFGDEIFVSTDRNLAAVQKRLLSLKADDSSKRSNANKWMKIEKLVLGDRAAGSPPPVERKMVATMLERFQKLLEVTEEEAKTWVKKYQILVVEGNEPYFGSDRT